MPLPATADSPVLPPPASAAPPSTCEEPSTVRSGALFLLDGLWRASSPLRAGEEAAELVARLEAAAARPGAAGPVVETIAGSPSASAQAATARPLALQLALQLALNMALTASAPVLERLADAAAAPLAGAGVKLSSSARARYAARAAAGCRALVAALRRLRDATPDAPPLLEHVIAHLS